jgi:hypothetical protein
MRWRAHTQAAGEPVGLPPLIERPDVPVRVQRSMRAWLVIWCVRPAWLWRRELLLAVGLGCWALVGWRLSGSWVGAVAVPGWWVVLFASVPVGRHAVVGWLGRGRLRRRWDRATRFAGLATSNDRIPRIIRQESIPVGEWLTVKMPRGSIVAELADVAEYIAADLRLRDVRVTRDINRAHLAHVQLIRRDPFARRSEPLVWPWLHRPIGRLWESIPAGMDELGDVAGLRLPGRNLLLGGEPESGKSAALSLVLGAAALDPYTRVVGLDAKRLELSLWRPVLSEVVYADIDEAISLMEWLISEMDATYERLEAHGLRKVPAGSPLTVWAVDELRFYTAHPNRSARERFNALAVDFVARGRAAGYIAVCATQKPSNDVVPTSLRDLFAYRWAMRCTTREASDTILGSGWASAGFSAAEIPVDTRGVGLLMAEGAAEPVKNLSYYLTDDDIRAIAARGARLRLAHGTA